MWVPAEISVIGFHSMTELFILFLSKLTSNTTQFDRFIEFAKRCMQFCLAVENSFTQGDDTNPVCVNLTLPGTIIYRLKIISSQIYKCMVSINKIFIISTNRNRLI